MRFLRLYRRPILLLEVIIAFALVILCALPLIYPHIFILKSEKAFVDAIQLDHAVNLIYGNILEKLYQKKIPWGDIEGGKEMPIEESLLREIGYGDDFPFKGTYRFSEIKHKSSEPVENTVYLIDLTLNFVPIKPLTKDAKPFIYEYMLTIERKFK